MKAIKIPQSSLKAQYEIYKNSLGGAEDPLQFEDWLIEAKKSVELSLGIIFIDIGIDRPENTDNIVTFVMNDIIETTDLYNYHDGDVRIAFRRFIESK
jgi:hypothetical protein